MCVPVEVLVFDLDAVGSGDHAADVEKAEAAFVLLIGADGLVDDARVKQGNNLAVWCPDDGSCASDADLWCGESHALGKGVHLGDALGGGDELRDDSAGVFCLVGKSEGACHFVQDRVAFLDDAKCAHAFGWVLFVHVSILP